MPKWLKMFLVDFKVVVTATMGRGAPGELVPIKTFATCTCKILGVIPLKFQVEADTEV